MKNLATKIEYGFIMMDISEMVEIVNKNYLSKVKTFI